jgi:hypothetical protein
MNDIQEFITDLLIEAGVNPEDHDDFIQELEPIVLQRIVSKLAVKLPPEKVDLAEKYLSTADSEKFWELCKNNIPNYEEYFVQILAEFEDEYLGRK